jgi:general secretion pathway protein C
VAEAVVEAHAADAAAPAPTPQPPRCDDPAAPAVRSPLHLALVATVIGERPGDTLVTLADLDAGRTSVLGMGERLGDAELVAVARVDADGPELAAIICRGGVKEFVGAGVAPASSPAPQPPRVAAAAASGIRSVGPHQRELDRRTLETALNDTGGLLTQARAVPALRDGATVGWRFVTVQPGSLLAGLGLRAGDVVQRINGYDLSSPEKAIELYTRLRDTTHVRVDLLRDGTPLREEVRITP